MESYINKNESTEYYIKLLINKVNSLEAKIDAVSHHLGVNETKADELYSEKSNISNDSVQINEKINEKESSAMRADLDDIHQEIMLIKRMLNKT